jgi:hypothetical protein
MMLHSQPLHHAMAQLLVAYLWADWRAEAADRQQVVRNLQ